VSRLACRAAPAVALIMTAAVAGCSGAPSTLDPRSPEAGHVARLWWLMFGLAATVFVVVTALVTIAVLRRRRRDPDVAPSPVRDRRFVVVGGLIVPAAIPSSGRLG
jgi:cytochrome c oxidase subunit II